MRVSLKQLEHRENGAQLGVSLQAPEILNARDVSVDGSVTKTSGGYLVAIDVNWHLEQPCDRCLNPATLDLAAQGEELFSAPEAASGSDEAGLDLMPLVRDLVVLNTPSKVLCKSTCRGLCPRCGVNWNESSCSCADDEVDVRLEVLKQLKLGE